MTFVDAVECTLTTPPVPILATTSPVASRAVSKRT